MRLRYRLVALTFGLAALAPISAAAKEEKVSLDQVPAAVVKAEKAKWPKAEIVGIEREEENGKVAYEFNLKEATRKWDASFDPAGKLIAVEETITAKDVPVAVKTALDKKYPQAKITLIEKVTEGDGPAAKTFYEYKIKLTEGGVELKFDPTGKLVAEEVKKGDEDNE